MFRRRRYRQIHNGRDEEDGGEEGKEEDGEEGKEDGGGEGKEDGGEEGEEDGEEGEEDGKEEVQEGDGCQLHRGYEQWLQQAQPPQGWQKREQWELWVAYLFRILNTGVCLTEEDG